MSSLLIKAAFLYLCLFQSFWGGAGRLLYVNEVCIFCPFSLGGGRFSISCYRTYSKELLEDIIFVQQRNLIGGSTFKNSLMCALLISTRYIDTKLIPKKGEGRGEKYPLGGSLIVNTKQGKSQGTTLRRVLILAYSVPRGKSCSSFKN